MSKEKEAKSQQKYGKEAFLKAEKNTNERLLLQVLLEDGKSYSKVDVTKIVKDWKQKEVKG
ncbi:hypothetical protein [Cytobacillus purgationiresistens]|uniref:Uncharacterized protein n=1 Tax=Cytobacillus purgationiresistens TaxID=863449 RepID=A0ABU0AFB0_9BACI|nr:hypothetical protein [Cytobacillus purgationiresistens]MDQ0269939.1 hypothetical protein [Cytobacillus purgationiresistens]